MPKLPAKAALALALALGCTAAPAPARTATTFVVPTELSNGRVEITVTPAYAVGSTITVPVAIVASRGSITGPLTARAIDISSQARVSLYDCVYFRPKC